MGSRLIIADTNLVAYLFVDGDQTAAAEACLRRDSIWIAPRIWRHEFVNVLATHIRADDLSLADARRILPVAARTIDSRELASVEEHRAIELAVTHRCASYDMEFLALAESLDLRIVTADQKLIRIAGDRAVSIVDFAAGR